MASPTKSVCAKCFESLSASISVKCRICNSRFHRLCAGIENEVQFKILKQSSNIVYNCNDCLNLSKDLVAAVRLLSNEVRELKLSFTSFINSSETSARVICNAPLQANINNDLAPTLSDALVADTASYDLLVTECVVAPMGNNFNKSNSLHNSLGSNTIAHEVVPALSAVSARTQLLIAQRTILELAVVTNKKWIHISAFKPTVTAEQIIEYVCKYSNISRSHLECFRLVKKDVDVNSLSKISFKLGISAGFYNELFTSSLWPADVKIRPFQFFQKPIQLEASS
ncbi:uncharacterized protein LOC142235882 [Haematobia irritans]|uniref:uncharacterized protein LOC142235882 n=1 Tax=Haematobia irritans TaxID=7368 RepID=UPI003F509741